MTFISNKNMNTRIQRILQHKSAFIGIRHNVTNISLETAQALTY